MSWEEKVYAESKKSKYRNGAAAGLIAGILVILFFFALDLLVFEPLATPRFLVERFYGEAPSESMIAFLTFIPVWIFTFVHLVAFVALGIGADWLCRTFIRMNFMTGGVYGAVVATALFGASLSLTGTRLASVPSWYAVILANLLAGILIGLYLKEDV